MPKPKNKNNKKNGKNGKNMKNVKKGKEETFVKPKVGFFDLSGCNGCLLSVAFNEEDLLDMAGHLDIQSFRFIIGKQSEDYNIAFVEGLVADNADLEKLLKIREKAQILIALGTCAHTGCIPAFRNFINPNKFANMVYDRKKDLKDTPPSPLSQHVKVDFTIPGCPPDRKQIKEFIKDLLLGKLPTEYDKSVCFECRLNENKCVLIEEGKPCLGPVTRGGCNSICTNSGFECWGCRGPTPDANREVMIKLLQEKGYKKGFIEKRMKSFVGLEIEKPARQKQPKALSLKKFKKIVEKKNSKSKPVKEEKKAKPVDKAVKKKTVKKAKNKPVKKKTVKKAKNKPVKKKTVKKAKNKPVKKKTVKKAKKKTVKNKAKKKLAKKKAVTKKAKKKVVKKKLAKKKPVKKKKVVKNKAKKKIVKKAKKKTIKKKAKKKVVKKKLAKKKPVKKKKVVKNKAKKKIVKKAKKKTIKKKAKKKLAKKKPVKKKKVVKNKAKKKIVKKKVKRPVKIKTVKKKASKSPAKKKTAKTIAKSKPKTKPDKTVKSSKGKTSLFSKLKKKLKN